MKIFKSISFRIWLPFAVSISAFILAAGYYYPLKQEQIFIQNNKSKIDELAKTVALGVELSLSSDNFKGLDKTIELAKTTSEFEFIAIVQQEKDLEDQIFAINPRAYRSEEALNRNHKKFVYASHPIKTDLLQGYVLIGISKEEIQRKVFELNQPVYIFLLSLLIVSLLAFLFFATTISKPIRYLTSIANQLEKENYSVEIIPYRSNNEIEELNNALFSLRDTLQEAKYRNLEFNKQLEDEIILRTKDLKDTRDKLIVAQRIAHLGSFEYYPDDNHWILSDVLYEILGWGHQDRMSRSNWLEALDPLSAIELEKTLSGNHSSGTFKKDVKIILTAQKTEKWLSIVGEIDKNSEKKTFIRGTIQDITDRKLIENEVNRLSLVATKTSNCVIITDKEKKMTWVNDSLLKLTGYSMDELIGKTPKIFQFEKTNPLTASKINEILALNKEVKAEILNIGKNGNEYWVDINIVPIYDQEEQHIGFMAVENDITQRKKQEEEILSIKDKLESILNEVNDVIWSVKVPDFSILFFSKSAEKLYEYSLEELSLIQNLRSKLMHPDDRYVEALISESIKLHSFFNVDYRIVCPTGKIKWITSKGKVIFNELGVPVRVDGIDTDITEVKMALERQKKFIKEAPSAIAMLDKDLKYLAVSDRWVQDYQLYDKDVIGSSFEDSFTHFSGNWKHILSDCISGATFSHEEMKFKRSDGSSFWLKMKINPWYNENDIVGGIIILTEDITLIKESKEEELRHILRLTQTQNDRLKNFAHIVSHNLRSHSGNIQSLIELMMEDKPDLKEYEFAKLIQVSSSNLRETITHLSEVAAMNVKENEKLSTVDLNLTVEKAIINVNAIAKNAEVKIINELKGDEKILGIPAYLDSIVLNFLTNGIKYRAMERESFIKIKSEKLNHYIVLLIEDNGLGIDLKRHGNKLFGMYKTFHGNPDSRGIGLFITKNQVEALGGRIDVDSTVGIGTTFKIFFKNEEN